MSKISVINKWDRFWRLKIIKQIESKELKRKKRTFFLKCDCWNNKIATLDSLRCWFTKSCWCLVKESSKKNIMIAIKHVNNSTHWMSKTKIYKVFSGINSRCYNKNDNRYTSYWWRWIQCEWDSFEEFYIDMWDSYEEWLEIDRIDVNWNYCKNNCRWVTPLQNSRNKQNSIIVDWLCLSEYCQKNSLNYKRVLARINRWNLLLDSLY